MQTSCHPSLASRSRISWTRSSRHRSSHLRSTTRCLVVLAASVGVAATAATGASPRNARNDRLCIHLLHYLCRFDDLSSDPPRLIRRQGHGDGRSKVAWRWLNERDSHAAFKEVRPNLALRLGVPPFIAVGEPLKPVLPSLRTAHRLFPARALRRGAFCVLRALTSALACTPAPRPLSRPTPSAASAVFLSGIA